MDDAQTQQLLALMNSTSGTQSVNFGDPNTSFGTVGVQTSDEGGVSYNPNSITQFNPNAMKPGDTYQSFDPNNLSATPLTQQWQQGDDHGLGAVGIVAMVVAPYLAQVIGPMMQGASQAVIDAVSQAVTRTVLTGIAGGDVKAALESGVTGAVMAGGGPDITAQINSIVNNPTLTSAIVSAGTSALSTAASGGSMSDIVQAAAGGAAGGALGNLTNTPALGSIAGGVLGGQGIDAVTGGLTSVLGQQLSKDINGATGSPASSPAPPPAGGGTLQPSADAQSLIDSISGGSNTALAGDATQFLGDAAQAAMQRINQLAQTPAGQAVIEEAAQFSDTVKNFLKAGVAGGTLTLGASILNTLGTNSGAFNWYQQLQQQQGSGDSSLVNQIPSSSGPYGSVGGNGGNTGDTTTGAPASSPAPAPAGSGELDLQGQLNSGTPIVETYYDSNGNPVTADVARAAQLLNISVDDAVKLQQQSPQLFAQATGGAASDSFKAADPNTMPSGAQTWWEKMGRPDLAGTGTTAAPASSGSTGSLDLNFTAPQDGVVASYDPQLQAALVILPDMTLQIVQAPSQLQTGSIVWFDPTTNRVTPAPAPAPTTNTTTTPAPAPTTDTTTDTTTATTPAPAPVTTPAPAPQTDTSAPTDSSTGTPAPVTTPAPPAPAPSPAPVAQTPSPVSTPPNVQGNVGPPRQPGYSPAPNVSDTPGLPSAPSPVSLGGVQPSSDVTVKVPPKQQQPPYPGPLVGGFNSPLQQALTNFVPAGEVGVGSGKPRQDVWNEASLRLKDALGV